MLFNRSSTLVLQKFRIATQPLPPADTTVEIVGRAQGLWAFLLSLMGLSPITRFTIAGSELRCESSSLFGRRMQFLPMQSICNITAGVYKPVSMLITAVAVLFFGIAMAAETEESAVFVVALVVSILLLIGYFLSKKFFFEIYSEGGYPVSLVFKPNVLEGVAIDMDRALAVVGVIRDLVLAHQHRPGGMSRGAAQVAAEPVWEEVEDTPSQETADGLYEQARQLAQAGQRDKAVTLLREVIRKYPASDVAKRARRNLEQLGLDS